MMTARVSRMRARVSHREQNRHSRSTFPLSRAPESCMHGLLLYPTFPDSSFWSYRHVMRMVGAKAPFPPLGLITFAALMPKHWTFDLLDLNVERPSDAE